MNTDTLTEMRAAITAALIDLDYTPKQAAAFLAGATIFGHLVPGGSEPFVRARLEWMQRHLAPMDDPLGHYGTATQPNPPTPSKRCQPPKQN